jgi:snRNA-activating protein complex subunit 3
MHDAALSTLALRINSPYWLLHAGDCEHNIVIDEIRYVRLSSRVDRVLIATLSLKHPSDPIDGYPLTLAIQPIMIDMCRGCSKVPAVWAVQGDIRLGESPCMLCAPCWRRMGMPRNAVTGQILVVPLPKYELGW